MQNGFVRFMSAWSLVEVPPESVSLPIRPDPSFGASTTPPRLDLRARKPARLDEREARRRTHRPA